MATYDKGDQVRVTGTFKTAGTVTDPGSTNVVAYQKKPDGTTTNLSSSLVGQSGGASAAGIYYVDIALDQIGTHTVKIESPEVVVASETIELVVTKSIFDHS
tara:strand:- start:1135 stop:1440 length:306 start_codon:yes stop_codon:yes gene_type:complete